jgi:hypothetical protein
MEQTGSWRLANRVRMEPFARSSRGKSLAMPETMPRDGELIPADAGARMWAPDDAAAEEYDR